eukprot:6180504-Pleurochrysis_carterae.AAC.2
MPCGQNRGRFRIAKTDPTADGSPRKRRAPVFPSPSQEATFPDLSRTAPKHARAASPARADLQPFPAVPNTRRSPSADARAGAAPALFRGRRHRDGGRVDVAAAAAAQLHRRQRALGAHHCVRARRTAATRRVRRRDRNLRHRDGKACVNGLGWHSGIQSPTRDV